MLVYLDDVCPCSFYLLVLRPSKHKLEDPNFMKRSPDIEPQDLRSKVKLGGGQTRLVVTCWERAGLLALACDV